MGINSFNNSSGSSKHELSAAFHTLRPAPPSRRCLFGLRLLFAVGLIDFSHSHRTVRVDQKHTHTYACLAYHGWRSARTQFCSTTARTCAIHRRRRRRHSHTHTVYRKGSARTHHNGQQCACVWRVAWVAPFRKKTPSSSPLTEYRVRVCVCVFKVAECSMSIATLLVSYLFVL